MPFLAGLEHEHDRAGQRLLARAQGAGGADQHRAVRIVPASVHRAGVKRSVVASDQVSAGPSKAGSVLVRLRMPRSEEHTSELQSLMRISYAVFCLTKKNKLIINNIDRRVNSRDKERT